MPPEAQVADVNGAAAFIRYYFDTMNYSYETGDTQPLQELADQACVACAGIVELIDGHYDDGGRIEGGQITVSEVVVEPGTPSQGLGASVVASQADGRALGRDGDVDQELAGTPAALYDFELRLNNDRWIVRAWGTHEAPAG